MAKQSVGVWFAVLVCSAILVSQAVASTDSGDVTAQQDLFKGMHYPPELKGWRLDGGDPCGESWEGVSCSESSVIYLKLQGLNLSGYLNGELFNFFNLKQLDLISNKIVGKVPYVFPLMPLISPSMPWKSWCKQADNYHWSLSEAESASSGRRFSGSNAPAPFNIFSVSKGRHSMVDWTMKNLHNMRMYEQKKLKMTDCTRFGHMCRFFIVQPDTEWRPSDTEKILKEAGALLPENLLPEEDEFGYSASDSDQ